MNVICNLANIIALWLTAAATIAYACITYYIRKAGQLQYVASIMVAFQNEWHNPRAALMRDYLHSKEYEEVMNTAIERAYATKIDYKKIGRLLERSELKSSDTDQERLEKFESYLKEKKYMNPLDPNKPLFSAYQAVYEVLLSFDRLAVVRDEPFMMEKCIGRYKPPIRDLSPVIQAFIAVRIELRESHRKNYKKEYMHLLAMLDIEDPALFNRCKSGLTERNELDIKEIRNWEAIQQMHAQRRG